MTIIPDFNYHFNHILTQIVARSVTVSESESDWSESDFDGTRGKVESQLNVKRFLKVETFKNLNKFIGCKLERIPSSM